MKYGKNCKTYQERIDSARSKMDRDANTMSLSNLGKQMAKKAKSYKKYKK